MTKHTESIENILKAMQTFNAYENMPPQKQLSIAKDVQYEIETYDVFLHEYLMLRFDLLPPEERRKYLLTSEHAWRLPEGVNIDMYYGKYDLLNKAKQFVSRDYMCIEDSSKQDLRDFLKRHEKIIVKPLHLQCGEDVKVYCSSECDYERLYDELVKNDTPLVEEYIYQHPEMAKFHPGSLNTIRITTLTDFDGNIAYKAADIRTGIGNSYVDNTSRGGISAPVDIESGIVIGDAIDSTCHSYEKHPDTGTVFKGFEIPRFDEVLKKADEYVRVFDKMHIHGWDIAIRENGDIELIEANTIPDLSIVQFFYGPLNELYKKLYRRER